MKRTCPISNFTSDTISGDISVVSLPTAGMLAQDASHAQTGIRIAKFSVDGCAFDDDLADCRGGCVSRESFADFESNMNIETLHIGMKVRHPQYGVGVVKSLSGQAAEIAFDDAQRTIAPASSDLQPAE